MRIKMIDLLGEERPRFLTLAEAPRRGDLVQVPVYGRSRYFRVMEVMHTPSKTEIDPAAVRVFTVPTTLGSQYTKIKHQL